MCSLDNEEEVGEEEKKCSVINKMYSEINLFVMLTNVFAMIGFIPTP